MKKKILLIISMFLFMTNVKALTFDVNLTNIEDKGTGTLGTITNIDIPNKEVNALFEDIGAEISFEVTVTNTGDRAGTLREINVTSENESMEYTTNLPEGGLSINGNDTNTVTITGKLLEGAVNGTSSSEVKIKYNYDEGSCPDGEILSDDESMCLCPEGMVRNEKGVCVTPEKQIVCEKDEIYNETKKICEKKVVPVVPENPKTLDNIILVTLLFMVSGLGLYAVMYKRLKTTKKKVTAGVITGVATLTLSFTVLAGVFGIDKLLGAIVNPITKSKELVITVNEEIDLIETWDGTCSIPDESLTPENIFEGGTGTEQDPYQVKTANQLACFARSVNLGRTYQNQYIKQTKTIKLNDDLNGKAESNNLASANLWTTAGEKIGWQYDGDINHFDGTYDGNNKTISGLYITDESTPSDGYYDYIGMFGLTHDATFKNMKLTDVYMHATNRTAALLGYGAGNLTLINVETYGTGIFERPDPDSTSFYNAGIVSNYDANYTGILIIENTTNNINLTCYGSCSGVLHRVSGMSDSDTPNLIIRGVINNGSILYKAWGTGSGIVGYNGAYAGNVLVENSVNTGNITFDSGVSGSDVAGLLGYCRVGKLTIKNSHNTGNITGFDTINSMAGVAANTSAETYVEDTYNSGNLIGARVDGNNHTAASGIIGEADNREAAFVVKKSYNTGNIDTPNSRYVAGIIGKYQGYYPVGDNRIIENCYNTGDLSGVYGVGGIAGYGGVLITKCYNTGNIYAQENNAGGLVGYGGSDIEYSYNTGTVTLDSEGSYVGGLCATDCRNVKNSYNTGDITILNSCADIGGIVGQYGTITNTYNSGNILFKGTGSSSYMYMSGIGYYATVSNSYNVGNVTVEDARSSFYLGGINVGGTTTNSVNTGTVSAIIKQPYTSYAFMEMGGINANGTAINSFNAGTVLVDETALDHSVSEDSFEGSEDWYRHHHIYIGEIIGETSSSSTGNKFNTKSDGYATCYFTNICDTTASASVGQYTTESTPDILSIINGDDAFEIKEGDTLPTLKVFNQ